MSPFSTLKTLKKEVGISSLFPVTHLNEPTIFETKTGFVGFVIKLQGVAFVTELNETLNQYARALHQALLGLDESLMAYVTIHRKKQAVSLNGEFTSNFAKQVDEKYHIRFKDKNVYHNALYLTIISKGNTSNKTSKALSWVNQVLGKQIKKVYEVQREQKIKHLKQICEQLLASLSSFKPHLLGTKDKEQGYSELLSFLSLVPNAGKSLASQSSQHASPIAKGLERVYQEEILYPNGHLGQYLSQHQILFGSHIQFEGIGEKNRKFGLMLSLKKYPKESGCLILDPLLEVDCEFIATHTFAPIERNPALEKIRLHRNKLDCAKDKAETQIVELTLLEDDIASEKASLGLHHNSIMVLGESIQVVDEAVYAVQKAYGYCGMVVVKETLGAEPCFWAQIPGNQNLIARAALITSKNFTDFCSFHNYQTGFYNANHLGEAVSLLETPSKTPVYFNFHTKGSKTNPSKGHTAIFGSNDAGKTTLVAFLDSQMNRYGGRTFFIDRDEACKVYILASGNSNYTMISPKNPNLKMNPLQLPDSPENRTFLKKWFEQLILKSNEADLPSHLAELVNECIDYSYEQLSPKYRTLTYLSRFFPVDFERWPELRRWLKAHDAQTSGEYAFLFDNEEDVLNLGFDKVGFDVTYLMDEVSSQISTPVYLYLVHRMRQSLDGRLTTFVFDEFQQVLRSPFWVNYLSSWLPTIRKLNGHFIFMTQSPKTVVDSPICATVVDNVATLLFFPNPQADEKTYIDALKLTVAEYQTIKNNTPESRLFLYKQGRESILCKLDLSNLQDELRIFSGNKKSAKFLDELIIEYGANPNDWLPIFIQRSKTL